MDEGLPNDGKQGAEIKYLCGTNQVNDLLLLRLTSAGRKKVVQVV